MEENREDCESWTKANIGWLMPFMSGLLTIASVWILKILANAPGSFSDPLSSLTPVLFKLGSIGAGIAFLVAALRAWWTDTILAQVFARGAFAVAFAVAVLKLVESLRG